MPDDGPETERASRKVESIVYYSQPVKIEIEPDKKSRDDDLSRRKRVLTLETQLRSAETVVLERDKKLESVM